MATTPPVTLDELRNHLNFKTTDTVDNNELARKLIAATDKVENKVGAMTVRTVTGRFYVRAGRLRFRYWPLLIIASVEMDGTAVALTSLDIDYTRGIAIKKSGCLTKGMYDLEYTAGREEIPQDLCEATLVVAAHLWETQRGSAGPPPGVPGQVPSGGLAPRGFALPNRAMELMADYMPPMVA